MEKNQKKPNDHADHNGSVRPSGRDQYGSRKRELNKDEQEDKTKGASRVARRLIAVAIAALLVLLGIESYRFAYRIANGSAVDSPPGRPISVYVHDNMSPKDVAEMLKDKGLLSGTLEFEVHAKLKGYNPSKYTGSHTLNTSMNAEQQLNELMNLNGD